ncbi:MAG: DNA-binding protein [Verrucomicrobiota bacterium]|nr:DNA-binding protein [Verrucomicrobiota bacterium]
MERPLAKQAGWEKWRGTLSRAAEEGSLVLCPVVFAECSAGYASVEEALAQIDSLCIDYDEFTPECAYLAGQMFLRYRREGGPRQHLIPDFLVAAHASVQADRLAAIDRGYLRTYFPALVILSPLVS